VESVPCLWQAGTTRLLDYGIDENAPIILVVPSLVNRFDILDIDQDRSFLRFLAGQGFRPLVVDWGEPGAEENQFAIEDYITQRLKPILSLAGQSGPVHLLGYCMGGTLALALALMESAHVKTLSLLATPWDFSGGVGGVPAYASSVGRLFMQQALRAQDYLQEVGVLPASFLQAVFTSFQPLNILQKFSNMARFENDPDAMRYFALTEDWLNDGVPLALRVSQEALRDWYGDNLPLQGKWKISDFTVDPSMLSMPAFILAAKRDRIVPLDSAVPLAKLIPNALLHTPDMGHIGLMVSGRAEELAWKPLVSWLRLNG